MSAHTIASKFRRALRNETGATFTNEQLRELGRLGVLRMLAEIEAEELCDLICRAIEARNEGEGA